MAKKTYTKTHKSKRAADGHSKNIRKRGGKVESSTKGSKTVLKYSFK